MLSVTAPLPLRVAVIMGVMLQPQSTYAFSSASMTSSMRAIPSVLSTPSSRAQHARAVAAASTNSADWYTKYSAVPSTGVQKAVVVPTAAAATKKAALPTKAIPVADPSALRKEDWGKNLRTMGSSLVLQRIAAHIVFNLVIASLVWGLRSVGVINSAFPGAPHALSGGFLGLLVTFRTNSAYARFWEARILWGGIMNTCRVLAIGVSVWVWPHKPLQARRFLQQLRNYPKACARQCRKEALGNGENPADFCEDMQNSLRDASTIALPAGSPTDGAIGLYELQLAEHARRVDMLADATGALNRIINTPLPYSYSRHTSRFLTVWCCTLPLAIGASVGLLPTLAAVGMVSWLVLGIDSIGQLLEQPFSQPVRIGCCDKYDFGLPVEDLSAGIAAEVTRVAAKSVGSLD